MEELDLIREDLLAYLEETLEAKEYQVLMIIVSDPAREGSEILFAEKESGTVNKAFNTGTTNNSMFLKGVVSRKKQIVPFLNSVLK